MWIYCSCTYFTGALELDDKGIVIRCPNICRARYKMQHKDYIKKDLENRKVLIRWEEKN